jgi:Lysozyme like domain
MLLVVGFGAASVNQAAQVGSQVAAADCGPSPGAPAPGADGGPGAGGGGGDPLSVLEVATTAAAGLQAEGVQAPTADQIATATAIAWAESVLDPRAHNATPPDDSYGLWQINMLGRLGPARRTKFGLQSNDELYAPAVNARAMASISLGGTNWQPWTTYTSGAYRQYLSRVTAEADQVAAASPGASDPNAPASPGAGCSGVGGPVADCGSAAVVRGDTTAVTFPQVTAATQTMAASAIQCFGRPYSVGCHSERPGDRFEHPRGRACDFMATAGGIAGGDERAWGQAMAEWVAAHAEELKVLYVIWADRSWNPADGDPVPWEQWRDYTGCANPCTDPTVGHFNHVHVSVHLQPGDPAWAQCTHLTCSE